MFLRQAPLQIWIPRLGPHRWDGVVARDAERAFATWKQEEVVFLLPELRSPCRRRAKIAGRIVNLLMLPAEHLDRIDVFHVNQAGWVWGASPERFPGGSVDSLLDAWLAPTYLPSYQPLLGAIRLRIPAIRRGTVVENAKGLAFEDVDIMPDPGPTAEGRLPSPEARTFTLKLTAGSRAPSVSPDAEALADYEAPATTWEGLPGSIGPDGNAQPRLLLVWPWPFSEIMSDLDAHDPLLSRERMKALLTVGRDEALRTAHAALSPFRSDGMSTVRLTRFWPTYIGSLASSPADDPRPVLSFWEELGIEARTLNEAAQHPKLQELVPVRRVWGGLGLLWTLFEARLDQPTGRRCERCGAVLVGKSSKRRCGPENRDCYRSQRTESRRRQRQHRKKS